MSPLTVIEFSRNELSPRVRWYAGAVLVTLGYLLIGRLSSGSEHWVAVDLPLSAISVMLVGFSGVEAYFCIRRLTRRHAELQATRTRDLDSAQSLAAQQQTLLNEISRLLIDKLDFRQMPAEVLDKAALLFETGVVALWAADPSVAGTFALQGVSGLTEASARRLDAIGRATPCFSKVVGQTGQVLLEDFRRDTAPAFAGFCEQEGFGCVVFNPIIRHDELVGILGILYPERPTIAPPLATAMQTVANLMAGALQAEEMYRDLVQIQKVDSLGTLASGITHDFNNVLAAILACASYVKQQTDPASPSYRYLEATEASAHRGAALTKQLLAFIRREAQQRTVLDPNKCIEQTLKIIEHSFDKTIVIERHLAANLHLVEADPSQLEQVILNVAVNARDAMPDGGTFHIVSRNVSLRAADPHRPPLSLADGEYVALCFRDTGLGMDQATLSRIFEPFFTTKHPGKGTGLGLSVVQSIVQNFGGETRVISVPRRGTLFEVYLPATTKVLPTPPAASTAPVRGGHERILLAEDEDVIREMAQLGLEAKGYQVLTAADGASALALYRDAWQSIDLVVADMVMPRASGAELVARMKEINPGVRVIVSSGYSHDQEGQRMLEQGCLGYLQKPYNTDTLCQAVRSVLDPGFEPGAARATVGPEPDPRTRSPAHWLC